MQRTLLLLLVLVAILGCRREVDVSKPSAVDAVARVDGEPIGTAEFVVAFTAAHALPDTPETRRELLDDLVLRRAGTRRAIQLGLDKDPEVRRALENVLVGALRKREFDSDRSEISVTPAEVEAYYASHADEFRVRPAFRVAVLYLASRGPEDPRTDALRARLDEARVRAAAVPVDEGFGPVSIESSDHQATRYRGGILGWLDADMGSRTFESNCVRIASSLVRAGDASPVFVASDGIYLVRLLDRRNESTQPLDAVAGRIRSRILQDKHREREAAYARRVLGSVPVEIFEERLASIELPARTASGPDSEEGPEAPSPSSSRAP